MFVIVRLKWARWLPNTAEQGGRIKRNLSNNSKDQLKLIKKNAGKQWKLKESKWNRTINRRMPVWTPVAFPTSHFDRVTLLILQSELDGQIETWTVFNKQQQVSSTGPLPNRPPNRLLELRLWSAFNLKVLSENGKFQNDQQPFCSVPLKSFSETVSPEKLAHRISRQIGWSLLFSRRPQVIPIEGSKQAKRIRSCLKKWSQ